MSQDTPDLNEEFQVIPVSERVELVKKGCKHEKAYVTETRPDGLVDVYCPTCLHGFLLHDIKELKND